MNNLGSKFLFQCKKNYFDNIRPSNKESYNDKGYKILVKIAEIYFENDNTNKFLNFFYEYQYNVNLWAAHLVLEYGKPNADIKNKAIDIIKRYSTTPLDEELAKEENIWLGVFENDTKSD